MTDVAEHWSSEEFRVGAFSPEVYWLAIPEVSARWQERAAGRPGVAWEEHCLSFIPPERRPADRMLSLGCGFGALEQALWRRGAFRQCDAMDVAPGAVEGARRNAAEMGIDNVTYSVADINAIQLERNAYDAVWFYMSLHHVEALEHVCEQVARCLKPDGFLFLNEYVGATRFAFPPAQIEAIQAAFSLIPPRYRHLYGRPDAPIRDSFTPPDPQAVALDDPSESVRSGEIVEIVKRYFTIEEYRPLGGTLLQFLLASIAGNFRTADPMSIRVLEMLFNIEDVLIETGHLTSDFVLIVARPKPA